jgi:hypothetical protein
MCVKRFLLGHDEWLEILNDSGPPGGSEGVGDLEDCPEKD